MANPRTCIHKSKFRTAPLERSNPFLKDDRRSAFTQSVAALLRAFPAAPEDWVRRRAWAKARTIDVPRKRRVAS